MVSFLTAMFMSVILFLPSLVVAREFVNPHQFSPGDVLSADMLNDLFDNIENASESVNEEDIVGSWSCDAYLHTSGFTESDQLPGWEIDASNLMVVLQDSNVEFSQSADGAYVMVSSSPNPIYYGYSPGIDSEYLVRSDLLIFRYSNESNFSPATYLIKKISNTKMVLYGSSAGENNFATLLCDRLNLPPLNPKQLSASLTTTTVSLTWQDSSDDETSFKILRKDSLTGDYAEIGTANENTTTYTDTLTTEGKYWYRVMATNENGDSVGSNVVKVTYGDDTESLKNELRMLHERIELIESEL